MRFLILQHIPCEHPGLFSDGMRERGIETETVELDAGDAIPDPADFDALLAFGGPAPEIGILEVELTAEGLRDPLFTGWPQRAKVFQWHADTFAVPEGAVWLARSNAFPHQAFRHGRCAYGLQYHAEVTPAMVAEWGQVDVYCGSLREATPTPPAARAAENSGLYAPRSQPLY